MARPHSPQIAREALALIDEQGLSSLTMRAVAGRMGVGVMSLYHHMPNRKALTADVVEAVLAGIETPPPQDGDWREPLSTAALGRLNATIGILMHAGFDAATAARIHRT